MRYTEESKQRVRDAVDMAEVVAAKTGELRRSGSTGLVGLCPFHDERTPSFSINTDKKLFYCFGCQEKGDVFDFVAKTEGLTFPEALEVLAERTGVTLDAEDEDPQAAERRLRRTRLLELMERTAAFYVRVLWEAEEAAKAREYLAGRGLAEASLREFRVGYAPSAWDRVLMASRRGGFSEAELLETGLAQRNKGGNLYDRFRSRITFPLCDTRGRVLGFGARAMGDNQGPKYLNSAEGELFHKGRIVYAADLARSHAARAGSVIVCEGYTDVIALHQAGIRNTVASMGTALTEEQVIELGRMAPTLLLALDADRAGQDAMLRAAKVAAGRKLELRVVPLPEGRDPADVAVGEGGAAAITALVDRALPFVRWRVQRTLAEGDRATPEGKDRIIDELRPVFATIGPSVLRDEMLRAVSDQLDVAAGLLTSLLGAPRRRSDGPPGAGAAAADGRSRPGPGNAAPPVRVRLDRNARTERTFLALCLAFPGRGRDALAALAADEHFTDPPTRRAAVWLTGDDARLDAPLDGLPDDDADLAALMAELVARATAAVPAEVTNLEVESLQLELARVDRQIVRAESGTRSELATRRRELQEELNRAMERALAPR